MSGKCEALFLAKRARSEARAVRDKHMVEMYIGGMTMTDVGYEFMASKQIVDSALKSRGIAKRGRGGRLKATQ